MPGNIPSPQDCFTPKMDPNPAHSHPVRPPGTTQGLHLFSTIKTYGKAPHQAYTSSAVQGLAPSGQPLLLPYNLKWAPPHCIPTTAFTTCAFTTLSLDAQAFYPRQPSPSLDDPTNDCGLSTPSFRLDPSNVPGQALPWAFAAQSPVHPILDTSPVPLAGHWAFLQVAHSTPNISLRSPWSGPFLSCLDPVTFLRITQVPSDTARSRHTCSFHPGYFASPGSGTCAPAPSLATFQAGASPPGSTYLLILPRRKASSRAALSPGSYSFQPRHFPGPAGPGHLRPPSLLRKPQSQAPPPGGAQPRPPLTRDPIAAEGQRLLPPRPRNQTRERRRAWPRAGLPSPANERHRTRAVPLPPQTNRDGHVTTMSRPLVRLRRGSGLSSSTIGHGD